MPTSAPGSPAPPPAAPAPPKAAPRPREKRTDHIRRAIVVLSVFFTVVAGAVFVNGFLSPRRTVERQEQSRSPVPPAPPAESTGFGKQLQAYRQAREREAERAAREAAARGLPAFPAASAVRAPLEPETAQYIRQQLRRPMLVRGLTDDQRAAAQAAAAPVPVDMTPSPPAVPSNPALAARLAELQARREAVRRAQAQPTSVTRP